MTNTSIKKTVFFAAPREIVWAFLTQNDKLAQWFHPLQSDLEQGKEYAFVRDNDEGVETTRIWGKVLTMEAPAKLVYTFIIGPFGKSESTVTWILEDAATGTRLSLIHEGIAEAAGENAMQMLTALDKGWDEHFQSLRQAQ